MRSQRANWRAREDDRRGPREHVRQVPSRSGASKVMCPHGLSLLTFWRGFWKASTTPSWSFWLDTRPNCRPSTSPPWAPLGFPPVIISTFVSSCWARMCKGRRISRSSNAASLPPETAIENSIRPSTKKLTQETSNFHRLSVRLHTLIGADGRHSLPPLSQGADFQDNQSAGRGTGIIGGSS